jgi:rhodanese-related sulfurtransferase
MSSFTRTLRKCAVSIVTLCLMLSASMPLHAAEAEFDPVSTEQLKDLLDRKQQLVLVDARTKEEYQEAHIAPALNITERDFEREAAALPGDKKTLLIFYCNGVKCGKSKKVAAKARAIGYSNILVYNDGFPVWEERGLPLLAGPDYQKRVAAAKIAPLELARLLREKKDEYLLVDVRDEFEYAEGHIPGAVNIPAAGLAAKPVQLPEDKKIIVYCNSGGGSMMAYRKMSKLAKASLLQAVFVEWKEAGLPVEKSKEPVQKSKD